MEKAVVLLSAGLDSTTNLFAARAKYEVRLALTVDYGQRASEREIACAKKICADLRIPHQVIHLPWVADFGKSALIDARLKVPTGDEISIDNAETSLKTAARVWVPNRNGILLNIAAGYAEALGASVVIPGFNSEEAATFPDNSEGFMAALGESFEFSTQNKVKVVCFTSSKNKTEIVKLAREMRVPFGDLWPCYLPEEKICRECESCQRFLRAMREAGCADQVG